MAGLRGRKNYRDSCIKSSRLGRVASPDAACLVFNPTCGRLMKLRMNSSGHGLLRRFHPKRIAHLGPGRARAHSVNDVEES